MTTVANTVKDVSRAITALDDVTTGALNVDATDEITRVAENLAYVMGQTVNLHKVTGREISLVLASHGYRGDLIKAGRLVAARIRGLAYGYSRLGAQL